MFKIAGQLVTLCSDEGYSVCGRQDLLSHFTIQEALGELQDIKIDKNGNSGA